MNLEAYEKNNLFLENIFVTTFNFFIIYLMVVNESLCLMCTRINWSALSLSLCVACSNEASCFNGRYECDSY